jgi:hypothetical protein
VSGETWRWYGDNGASNTTGTVVVGAGGLLFAGPLLMILFRQKYPRWWFDWNLELTRFSSRVALYGALLDDRYPSTDERQSLRLDIPYPDARTELSRWLPLVKWFLAIPHYIVLVFLGIAALICIVIAWFAILFTGRYPRELFDFVVGVHRPLPALLVAAVDARIPRDAGERSDQRRDGCRTGASGTTGSAVTRTCSDPRALSVVVVARNERRDIDRAQ